MGIYIFVSILSNSCMHSPGIMIVLVQNSKGGGLAANFTSTGQSMGIRKTADFLEKSTWTLAGCNTYPLCGQLQPQYPGSDFRPVKESSRRSRCSRPNAIPTLPTAVPQRHPHAARTPVLQSQIEIQPKRQLSHAGTFFILPVI